MAETDPRWARDVFRLELELEDVPRWSRRLRRAWADFKALTLLSMLFGSEPNRRGEIRIVRISDRRVLATYTYSYVGFTRLMFEELEDDLLTLSVDQFLKNVGLDENVV